MKLILIFLVLITFQEKSFYVNVEVKDIKGKVFVAVYDAEHHFMKVDKAKYSNEVKVDQKHLSIFIPLGPGDYAVTVFHDLDSNNSLNTNFFGIPTEPYGFSNDAEAFAGPPDFKDALFAAKVGETYLIRLR